jgi:hypothetical protein
MFKFVLAGTEALKLTSAELTGAKLFQKIKPKAVELDDATKQAASYVESLFIDGTRFAAFKHGRTYLLQMHSAIRKVQERIETIEQACQFIQNDAWTLSCHYHWDKGRYDRFYSAMGDYLDSDLRVCLDIRCYANCTYLQVQERSGYDEKSHSWPDEGSRYQTCIESKRGQKQLLDLQYSIAELGGPAYCNQNKYTAHRKNGKLTLY